MLNGPKVCENFRNSDLHCQKWFSFSVTIVSRETEPKHIIAKNTIKTVLHALHSSHKTGRKNSIRNLQYIPRTWLIWLMYSKFGYVMVHWFFLIYRTLCAELSCHAYLLHIYLRKRHLAYHFDLSQKLNKKIECQRQSLWKETKFLGWC